MYRGIQVWNALSVEERTIENYRKYKEMAYGCNYGNNKKKLW